MSYFSPAFFGFAEAGASDAKISEGKRRSVIILTFLIWVLNVSSLSELGWWITGGVSILTIPMW
jgi:hypothetical protein